MLNQGRNPINRDLTRCCRKNEYERGTDSGPIQARKEYESRINQHKIQSNCANGFFNHSGSTAINNTISNVHVSPLYFSVSPASWLTDFLEPNHEDAKQLFYLMVALHFLTPRYHVHGWLQRGLFHWKGETDNQRVQKILGTAKLWDHKN